MKHLALFTIFFCLLTGHVYSQGCIIKNLAFKGAGIRGLNDDMAALYTLVLENLNRHELTEADWARTISV